MPLTPTSAQPTSTHPTYTSRLAFNSCRMDKHLLVRQTRAMPPYLKTYIPRLISLRLFMVPLLHSGVLHSLSSRLKALLLQLWRLAGIALLHRSATQVCRPSS